MTNRKNDTKFHEVLKQASICVYHGKNAKMPTNYRVIDKAENKDNGFYAEAYSNGKDIIIAYRGTDTDIIGLFYDIQNNHSMVRSELPSQCTDAIRFYDKVVRENPNCDITVTGHSLGGSNAEIVSAIRGVLAVTFNAYGVRDMFTSYTILNEDNVVNYVNEMDGATMVNGHNHIGEIYSVPNVAENSVLYKINCHIAEGMGNLSQRTQKTPVEIKEKAERIHPNAIKAKDGYNKGCDTGKKYVDRVNTGIDKVIDTTYKVKNKVSECVGSYYVNGYRRNDGTTVEGYVRTCGAKHNN